MPRLGTLRISFITWPHPTQTVNGKLSGKGAINHLSGRDIPLPNAPRCLHVRVRACGKVSATGCALTSLQGSIGTAFPQRRYGPDRHPIPPDDPLVIGTASTTRPPTRHGEYAGDERLFWVEILATAKMSPDVVFGTRGRQGQFGRGLGCTGEVSSPLKALPFFHPMTVCAPLDVSRTTISLCGLRSFGICPHQAPSLTRHGTTVTCRPLISGSSRRDFYCSFADHRLIPGPRTSLGVSPRWLA
jgi:hypothetical protein